MQPLITHGTSSKNNLTGREEEKEKESKKRDGGRRKGGPLGGENDVNDAS